MSKFDRYILSQLLTMFGFFALVLVSVYWVNRAVVLFDQLIASGQTASVFLELTILSLPNLIRLVLPMAVFAATIYVINRLNSESELTVMQATGISPWRLARPVFYFGMLVALMMTALTHFLVPASLVQLSERKKEITENVTARLLTEGTFLHPASGITFYIREITPAGVLKDVFLSDKRSKSKTTSYTAAEAFLVQDETGAKLVMLDGLAQTLDNRDNRLITTNFSDFSYDISALMEKDGSKKKEIKHLNTIPLMFKSHLVSEDTGIDRGRILYEAHGRVSQAFTCIVFSLVGFSVLLLGGYSRFGVWRQIIIGFVLLIFLEMMKSAFVDPVRDDATLWPLVYVPALAGALLVTGMLCFAANPFNQPRQVDPL
ncbi:LPS export ABC transporter permease LptF [Pseudopelagicola sp. nBUS_20]|uniref:LPS export ABC transporter permease LptF n=1 Tax=Pseudopelagicola sp. nBUS_20 TaxID=3395317 RepID=UPI003EB84540